MEEALKDERFSHILTDPKFRKIPKNVRKIKVDNRFKNLFKTNKFSHKCSVDERGRTLNLETSENLNKLYNLDEESSDGSGTVCSEQKSIKSNSEKLTKKIKEKKSGKKLKSKHEKDQGGENILLKADLTEKGCDKSNVNKNAIQSSKKNKTTEISLKQSSKKSKNKNRIEEQAVKIDNRFVPKWKSEESDITSEEEKHSRENIEISSHSDEDSSENGDEISEASSSEDESDSSDSDVENNDEFDHEWEEQHEKAPDTDDVTRRLAVCNMDWDRMRAVDLYAVFNSFKPPDASISSVKIYPSEYGMKRMEEEKIKGPPELVEKTLASDEEDEVEDTKGGKYNREKLRQYQMNRMKYYYAVVECDTPETANAIYEQLNGMEYESSSVRFDLRFVPDEMTFDQEPTSVANSNSELSDYKPRLFVTTALQQVKVGLTWDETDPHRREILQKAFTEPDTIEKDIQAYLASSSGDSEEEESQIEEGETKSSMKERIQKYKALLESLNEEEKDKNEEKFDMEITWESGAKEKTENLVKEKIEEKSYTPFEEIQKKRKEKQKKKKKQKKMENNNGEQSENSASDLDESDEDMADKSGKISSNTDELYLITDSTKPDDNQSRHSKKKKKKKTEPEVVADTEIDVNDPRFSAIYTSPLFNIDPSDPHFKKTPGNLAFIAEKQRRLKHKAMSTMGNSHKKMKM